MLECLNECSVDKRRKTIIIGSVLGAVGGVMALLISLVCYKTVGCCICFKYLPCHKYQKLKRQYNIISPGNMSQEQYNAKKDLIVAMLNTPKTFISSLNSPITEEVQCYIVKEKDFLT